MMFLINIKILFLIILFYTFIFIIIVYFLTNKIYNKNIEEFFFKLKCLYYACQKDYYFIRYQSASENPKAYLIEKVYNYILTFMVNKIKVKPFALINILHINLYFYIISYLHNILKYYWFNFRKKLIIIIISLLLLLIFFYYNILIIICFIYISYINILLLLLINFKPEVYLDYTKDTINSIIKYQIAAIFSFGEDFQYTISEIWDAL